MIVPVWLSNGGKGEFGPKHRGHRPSDVALIHSDDRGVTWRRGDFVARNDQIVAGVKAVYPSETTAVELSDGSITGMCDDRYVRLARFNLAWLTGKDVVPKLVLPK